MYILMPEVVGEWGFRVCVISVNLVRLRRLLAYAGLAAGLECMNRNFVSIHMEDEQADWYEVEGQPIDFGDAKYKLVETLPGSLRLLQDASQPETVFTPYWVYWEGTYPDGNRLSTRALVTDEVREIMGRIECGSL
jgi:hypothetical protein